MSSPIIRIQEVCTSPVYSIRFSVEGRGVFPYDILRWDACYPEHPEAAEKLFYGGGSQLRKIDLKTMKCVKHWLPAVERWRNFGWIVVNEEPEV